MIGMGIIPMCREQNLRLVSAKEAHNSRAGFFTKPNVTVGLVQIQSSVQAHDSSCF